MAKLNIVAHDKKITSAATAAGLTKSHIDRIGRYIRRQVRMAELTHYRSPFISLYRGDANDAVKVLNFVKRGEFVKADRKLDNIDPCPRDTLWRILGGVINRGIKRNRKSR